MNKKSQHQITEQPFHLAYLDWCRDIRKIRSYKETQNRNLVREFYYSEYWKEKPINGIDFALCFDDLTAKLCRSSGGKL